MALRTVDLTKQPYKAVFVGCSEDEINYAKTFWQSVQLLPPMESRLVSSDIKQRLRKAPHSRSMSEFLKDDETHLWHGLSYSHANSTFTMKLVGGPTIEKRIDDGKDDNYPNIERADTNIGPICQILGLGGAGRELWSRHPYDTSDGYTERHLDAIELGGEELSRNRSLHKWGEAEQLAQTESQCNVFEFGGEDLRGVRTRPQKQDNGEGSCFKINEMLFIEKDAQGKFKRTTLPLKFKTYLLEENNNKDHELSIDSSCDQFNHIKIANNAEDKKLELLTEPQRPEGKRMQKKTFTSAQENATKSRNSERKRTSTDGPYLSHKPLSIRQLSSFTSHQTLSGASNLRDFFVRAKTMEHIEEFKRLHHFATARDEDREILHKHRDERIQKEKISHQIKPKSAISNLTSISLYSAVSKEKEDDYDLSDDLSVDVKEEISNFEKVKGAIDDRDSDSN